MTLRTYVHRGWMDGRPRGKEEERGNRLFLRGCGGDRLFGESALYVMNGIEGVCHPSSRSRDKLLAGMPRRLAVANIFAFLGLVFVREVARGIFQG